MTDRYARVKPLGSCPHGSCVRGNKSCLKLAAGKAWPKTLFPTHHDWTQFMIARFNDLDRVSGALGKCTEEETWCLDVLCDALDRRIEDRRIHESQPEAAISECRPE